MAAISVHSVWLTELDICTKKFLDWKIKQIRFYQLYKFLNQPLTQESSGDVGIPKAHTTNFKDMDSRH